MLFIKNLLKKIFPKLYLFYHYCAAYAAVFLYRYPSRKLIVIGVTGTAGKSTVVYLASKMIKANGHKVGTISTLGCYIGENYYENPNKMTMPGPFYLQKMLSKMVKSGCAYAIIETSSQGLILRRHFGIDYDLILLNNLYPEHLEAHGSFEKYRNAKGILFRCLNSTYRKKIGGHEVEKAKIVNLDDKEMGYFLDFAADQTYGFSLNDLNAVFSDCRVSKIFRFDSYGLNASSINFCYQNFCFESNLFGRANLQNILASLSIISTLGLDARLASLSLQGVEYVPGRFEKVLSSPFQVIVDYAHTPDELLHLYQFAKEYLAASNRIISVFGSAGGGRDKWKRRVSGELADKHADFIILTNEDPYDEDPQIILNQIAEGIQNKEKLTIIPDRRLAIRKALSIAGKNDAVLISGKGSEKFMMVAHGQALPWSDKSVVEEEYRILRQQ